MAKKIFGIFSVVLILCFTIVTPFAQTSQSDLPIDQSARYYSKFPLDLNLTLVNNIDMTDTPSVSVPRFGNTLGGNDYISSPLGYFYTLTTYNNNGYYTDVHISGDELSCDTFTLSASNIYLSYRADFFTGNNYRLYLTPGEYDRLIALTNGLSIPIVGSFHLSLYDENRDYRSVYIPINDIVSLSAVDETIRGVSYKRLTIQHGSIILNAIYEAGYAEYDYLWTDQGYGHISDLSLNIFFTLEMNSDYGPVISVVRHLENEAPTTDFQSEAEEHILGYLAQRVTDVSKNPLEELSFTDWIVTAVGGFMDFEIIPGISIGGMLAVCIGIGLLIMFLKVFAGG